MLVNLVLGRNGSAPYSVVRRQPAMWHACRKTLTSDVQELSKTREAISRSKSEIERFRQNSCSDWFCAFFEMLPSPVSVITLVEDEFIKAAWQSRRPWLRRLRIGRLIAASRGGMEQEGTGDGAIVVAPIERLDLRRIGAADVPGRGTMIDNVSSRSHNGFYAGE